MLDVFCLGVLNSTYDVDAKHPGMNLYQLEKGGIKYTLVYFIRKNQPKAYKWREGIF